MSSNDTSMLQDTSTNQYYNTSIEATTNHEATVDATKETNASVYKTGALPANTSYVSIAPDHHVARRYQPSKDEVMVHDVSIPSIFRGKSRRTGNWPDEEINYAQGLTAGFLKGQLDDCRDGVSLRNYLAAKLYCRGMRICKKFPGKSYGTILYQNRRDKMDPKRLKDVDASIQEHERIFYNAIVTTLSQNTVPSAARVPHKHASMRTKEGYPMRSRTVEHLKQSPPMHPEQANLPLFPKLACIHNENAHEMSDPALTPSLYGSDGFSAQLEALQGTFSDASRPKPEKNMQHIRCPVALETKNKMSMYQIHDSRPSPTKSSMFSPRITSQSFGELDALLAEDSILFGLDNIDVPLREDQGNQTEDNVPSTDSFYNSYLSFALESIKVISQHAAYQKPALKRKRTGKEFLQSEAQRTGEVVDFRGVDQIHTHATSSSGSSSVNSISHPRVVSETSSSGANSEQNFWGKEESISDSGDSQDNSDWPAKRRRIHAGSEDEF